MTAGATGAAPTALRLCRLAGTALPDGFPAVVVPPPSLRQEESAVDAEMRCFTMLDILCAPSLSGAERTTIFPIADHLWSKMKDILAMFSGSIPALVTPFYDGAFSEKHFRALIDWQIEQWIKRSGACRDDGGIIDAVQCRASSRDRSVHRTGSRTRSGDCRLRVERYEQRDSPPQFFEERAGLRRVWWWRLIITGPIRRASTPILKP